MKNISLFIKITFSFILLINFSSIYAKDNSQIKQQIINQSINNYSGNCPCPYNRASNGSRCGKRSAYSRAGGYSPICYESDITNKMLIRYQKNRIQK